MLVPSVSQDKVTEVDGDRKMCCREKGGEEKEEEERDVGRLGSHGGHPGPRGGGGALPLSYVYPLATVRLAG